MCLCKGNIIVIVDEFQKFYEGFVLCLVKRLRAVRIHCIFMVSSIARVTMWQLLQDLFTSALDASTSLQENMINDRTLALYK